MIIQITNRCFMNCPHCMEDSRPDGEQMTRETFDKVLDFVSKVKPLIVGVSGGEPLEHPLWECFVKELLSVKGVLLVSILTNGSWIEDKEKRLAMAQLLRKNKDRVKVQVFSHPKYYQDHEWTVEHRNQFKSIGCLADFDSPIFMQDLGRARKNCQEEVEKSDFVPSCINSHLLAIQAHSLTQFCSMAAQAGKFCRPLIDFRGDIHMSESWLCPTVASVDDGPDKAFEKMKASRPCKGCRLYKNFTALHPKEMELLK